MKQKVKTSNKKYILSKKRLDYLRLVYRPGQISSYVLSLPRPTGQEKTRPAKPKSAPDRKTTENTIFSSLLST